MQIEYALTAVAAGATSLGIRATNGVVLATEKKLPSLLVDEGTVQKISLLTPNIGLTYSGMGPDSRVLVRKARKSGQVYYRQYHEHIPVAQLCRETAAVMQEFTRGWGPGGRAGRAGREARAAATQQQRRQRSRRHCSAINAASARHCCSSAVRQLCEQQCLGAGCRCRRRLQTSRARACQASAARPPACPQNPAACGPLACRC